MLDAGQLKQLVAGQLSRAMTAANTELAKHHRLEDMAERAQADAQANGGAVQALQNVMEAIASLEVEDAAPDERPPTGPVSVK